VLSFLKSNFSEFISNLEMIIGGEGSQAYSFEIGAEKYIIRINKHYSLGFKKDEYAYVNYSKKNIPIPKIYKIGKIDEQYNFCISQRAEGKVLNSLSLDNLDKLNQELFRILDLIHAVDISNTEGYGKWNELGFGENKSWKERILSADEYAKTTEEKPGLFDTTFLEKDFWDLVYGRMVELLKYCPEERYLVHGDYGFGNILFDGEKITAIIDWESSMYGDFLFDVAWLGIWSQKVDYIKLYLEQSLKKGIEIKNFNERILCYKLYIGLRTLSFFAYSDQEDKYHKLKETISKFL
jgi:hygromycin-B 4-O-kinase